MDIQPSVSLHAFFAVNGDETGARCELLSVRLTVRTSFHVSSVRNSKAAAEDYDSDFGTT